MKEKTEDKRAGKQGYSSRSTVKGVPHPKKAARLSYLDTFKRLSLKPAPTTSCVTYIVYLLQL